MRVFIRGAAMASSSSSWFSGKRPCDALIFEQALQNAKTSVLLNEWLDGKLDERFKATEVNLNEQMEINFDTFFDKMEGKLSDRNEVVEILRDSKQLLEERVQLLEAEINDRNTRLLGLSGANAFNKFLGNHNTELKDRIKQLEQMVFKPVDQ
jgi:hypothetical protein